MIDNFLYIVHITNEGAAWGILSGQTYLLSSIALLALAAVWIFRNQLGFDTGCGQLALGIFAGGVVGNLFDRICYGHVIDFIDVHLPLIEYRWPAFNVADCGITVGVAVYIISVLIDEREKSARKPAAEGVRVKNKIASFGEIVWDCFGDSKTLGGAPLNFAYFCAKFGCDSAIISAVGNDGLGRAALAKIAEIRLDARAVAVLPDLPTGIVDVSEGSDGLPAYNIRRPAAWDEIGLSEAAAEIAAGCGAFCFGTLAQRSETSRKTLFALLETLKPSCLKVFDANLRQNYFDAKILAESLEYADMLKLNDSELPVVHGLLFRRKCAELREMAEEIAEKFSLKFLACTLGAEGHIVFSRGEEPARGLPEPVEVADTVGAGDAFTAGFVSAILDGDCAAGAAKRAAKSAAYACSRRGAIE